MKSITLFSLTILTLMTVGCEESPAQNKKYGNNQVYEAVPVNNVNENKVEDKIIIHTVKNPQTGQPSMYIPFPSSWKFIDGAALGEPAIKGPKGLTFISYPPQSYIYSNNSMMNQTYQSNGLQVMTPVGIENVLNQVIFPQGQQMGMTLLNQYPLSEIAAKDREYSARLGGGDSPQKIFQVAGTEWKDGAGNKVLVVVHYFEIRSSSIINWGYNAEMLKVEQPGFEQAKKQYVYAMANKVFDQNDVAKFKIELAGKIKSQEEVATNIRKINEQGSRERLAGDAAANEHARNSNSAMVENKNHNNDLLQEQTNNALNNVNVVISPFDGKEYQVESGNKTYWINNEGKYIKSDDPLYDPNKFEGRVGVWKKAPTKVYK